jgi:pimeloyl-ACP methyl ester carboxylesterase
MNGVLAVVAGGAGMCAAMGLIWQAIAARRDRHRFPPPGRLVSVGSHHLHLQSAGPRSAMPTVVLEAGMASMSANWAWVQTELARDHQVVSYDRAGLGWSEPGSRRPDAATSATELHAALEAAECRPPYVLVGHSYGGLVVRMFADQHPDMVVGMVLVDASHPDQWAHIPAARDGRTVAWANRLTAAIAYVGLLRLFRAERPYITGLPARQYAEMRAYLSRPDGWRIGAQGLFAWGRRSRAQVNAARSLGNLPLLVLSVTEQSRYSDVLTRLQDELVSLSSRSRHVTVAGANHYTLVSEQQFATAVSDAVRAVISAAQTGTMIPEIR